MAIKLIGFDELTEKICKVELTSAEVQSMDCDDAIKRLFRKFFRESFFAVRWFCGVPGVDRAVVFQGTTPHLFERYLHVSFSDGRTW